MSECDAANALVNICESEPLLNNLKFLSSKLAWVCQGLCIILASSDGRNSIES